jgi:hypothetical protein
MQLSARAALGARGSWRLCSYREGKVRIYLLMESGAMKLVDPLGKFNKVWQNDIDVNILARIIEF